MKNVSLTKLEEYRIIRNTICAKISIAQSCYKDNEKDRKKYLEQIAFYKDVLWVLSKHKGLITKTE